MSGVGSAGPVGGGGAEGAYGRRIVCAALLAFLIVVVVVVVMRIAEAEELLWYGGCLHGWLGLTPRSCWH